MAEIGKTNFLSEYEDIIKQPFIVYAYVRKSDDTIVYIGADKNGDKNRRKIEHEATSHVGKQMVNRAIQKNPDNYYYQVIAICPDEEWMFDIEASLINTFKAIGDCKLNKDQELKDDILEKIEGK